MVNGAGVNQIVNREPLAAPAVAIDLKDLAPDAAALTLAAGSNAAPSAASPSSAAEPPKRAYSAPHELPTQDAALGVRFDFNEGCRLLLPESGHPWRVRLSDIDTGNVLFETELKAGRVNSTKRYYVRFRVEVWQQGQTVLAHEYAAADREAAIEDRVGADRDYGLRRADLRRAQLDQLTGAFGREIGLLLLDREINRARHGNGQLVLAYIDRIAWVQMDREQLARAIARHRDASASLCLRDEDRHPREHPLEHAAGHRANHDVDARVLPQHHVMLEVDRHLIELDLEHGDHGPGDLEVDAGKCFGRLERGARPSGPSRR